MGRLKESLTVKKELIKRSHFLFCSLCIMFSACCFRFLNLKGHEMFCEIERSYIEDGFNLYGLRACVSNFSDCLDLILDRIGPDEDSDDSQLTQSACTLYGLIHARYIITAHGLDAMYSKVSVCDMRSENRSVLVRHADHVGIKSKLTFRLSQTHPVRCKRVWDLSFGTMRCTASSSSEFERRNGGGYGKNILPKVLASLSPTACPQSNW